MSTGGNAPFDLESTQDLERLRLAAAGILRDFLSAAEQAVPRPQAFTDDLRQMWWNERVRPAQRPIEALLRNASARLRNFPLKFGNHFSSLPGPGDSFSVQDSANAVRELMMTFAVPDELDQAANRIRNSEAVEWDGLCRWDDLAELRQHLNELPLAADLPRPPAPAAEHPDELTAVDPFTIRFGSRNSITQVRSAIWRFIKFLLGKANWTSTLDDLENRMWDDKPSKAMGEDPWGRVHSLTADTRNFFLVNDLPFTVSSDKRADRIFMVRNDPSMPEAARTKGQHKEEAVNQASTKSAAPRKRVVRKKGPRRRG